MHLFYCSKDDFKSGLLSKEESHHAFRVLRLNLSDYILVTEGKGTIYKAKISSLNKTKLEFSEMEVYSNELKRNHLHIAIAPTKSLDRFEFFLEKATEVGVDEISPIFGFHSERKVYKTERGKKIILAAAKQSKSHWLTQLNNSTKLSEFMKSVTCDHKFIAHCEEGHEKFDLLESISKIDNSLVLIGPEGDFSSKEIKLAMELGFKPVSLGQKRLRTETAGVAVAIAAKIIS